VDAAAGDPPKATLRALVAQARCAKKDLMFDAPLGDCRDRD
jgi:hypothetical protein